MQAGRATAHARCTQLPLLFYESGRKHAGRAAAHACSALDVRAGAAAGAGLGSADGGGEVRGGQRGDGGRAGHCRPGEHDVEAKHFTAQQQTWHGAQSRRCRSACLLCAHACSQTRFKEQQSPSSSGFTYKQATARKAAMRQPCQPHVITRARASYRNLPQEDACSSMRLPSVCIHQAALEAALALLQQQRAATPPSLPRWRTRACPRWRTTGHSLSCAS